jgi:hypothetical protein
LTADVKVSNDTESVVFSINVVFQEAVSKEITRTLRNVILIITLLHGSITMADKTHVLSAMGIYDWINSIDVSVLDDFKSYPGSTVSITFDLCLHLLADMAKQEFDQTEFFEPNWKDLSVDK